VTTPDYRARIGARIRRTREAKGWTQRQLAYEVDIAEAQISRWENGRAMPNPQSLEAVARALDVPAETFLRD
jgi:transcriptional regulator with XRE-family HTH domain